MVFFFFNLRKVTEEELYLESCTKVVNLAAQVNSTGHVQCVQMYFLTQLKGFLLIISY